MRGQASVLTTLILTAAAVAIGLALWSYFVSVASIQREEALTMSAIIRESSRVLMSKVSAVTISINGTEYLRVAFQVSTADYQPILLYFLALNDYTTSPTPLSINAYIIKEPYSNISNATTLNLMTDREEIRSDHILLKPFNSNDYVPLSLYWKGVVSIIGNYFEGQPTVIVIEVRKDLVSNAWLIPLIKINEKFYQIGMYPLS